MNLPMLDRTIYSTLNHHVSLLEDYMQSDCFLYYGEITQNYKQFFVDEVSKLAQSKGKRDRLAFHIHTPGGVAEVVEKMVEVIRHYYQEVYFIVPDAAMSAGTILCMSGDKIFMDHSSSLGPIDPQVYCGGKLVPAQGYLDQFEKLLEKSRQGTITAIEVQMVRDLNLADLNFYDQARNLTVTLLKKWLVQYKFKDWSIHSTSPEKKGAPVTPEEKLQRAEEIARKLGDNAYWHSHGRFIGMNTLREELRLQIENYSEDMTLSQYINQYNRLAVDYAQRQKYGCFLHSRAFTNVD